jgi:hypothetical protein
MKIKYIFWGLYFYKNEFNNKKVYANVTLFMKRLKINLKG